MQRSFPVVRFVVCSEDSWTACERPQDGKERDKAVDIYLQPVLLYVHIAYKHGTIKIILQIIIFKLDFAFWSGDSWRFSMKP